MTLLDLLKSRYACKKFNGKRISDEQLATLKEAIRLSPSSLNSQPWRVKIIGDQETKELLFPEAKNQVQITTCSHLFVLCTVHDLKARFEEVIETLDLDEKGRNILNEKRKLYIEGKTEEEQRHYAELQCYMAAMSFLLAVEDLGLASCPMAGFSKEGIARILNLKEETPVLLLPVGFPDFEPRKKKRLSEEKIFIS